MLLIAFLTTTLSLDCTKQNFLKEVQCYSDTTINKPLILNNRTQNYV